MGWFCPTPDAEGVAGGDSPHRGGSSAIWLISSKSFSRLARVLSIDTKKKEYLGTLYRDGKVYCQQALKAFDHDVPVWPLV